MSGIIPSANILPSGAISTSVLPDSILLKPDGDYFVTLSNGQFEIIKQTFNQMIPYPLTVIALIPVHWQYFISTDNLKPAFVGFSDAESRVHHYTKSHPFPRQKP